MNTQPIPFARAGTMVMGLLAVLVVAPGGAAAQGGGWSALLGCWQPSPMEALEPGTTPEDRVICITPGANSLEVELATWVDGQLANRETIDASGTERAFDRDGCLGTESARISDDGRRIYQQSEYSCPGPFTRTTSGVLSMLPGGEWLSVQGVASGDYAEVQVIRHRRVADAASIDPSVAQALAGREMVIRAAQFAAGAPLTLDEVIDVSDAAHPSVVEAWLIEYGQGFGVSAADLIALDEAGVPGGVIDLVVALSNPRVFAIDLSSRQGEFRPDETFDPGPRRGYYDPWYDRYGRRDRYDPWGYRYGGYYYYPYRNPPVIIIENPGDGGAEAPSRTRLVRGQGYTQSERPTATESGSSGGSRSTTPASGTTSRPSNSAGSSGSSGSSTSRPSAGSDTSSGGSSSTTTRTARPRPE